MHTHLPETFGSANAIMSSGSTSTMPPTPVLTTYKPQLAASTIAMQNASVSDVFKKIWPWTSTCALAIMLCVVDELHSHP
jgi:hypothetical protein